MLIRIPMFGYYYTTNTNNTSNTIIGRDILKSEFIRSDQDSDPIFYF